MKTSLPMLNGKLRKYTDLGGYPIFYLDSENSVLCADCAEESRNDDVEKFRPVAADVNWESDDLYCDQCSQQIESAYSETQERIDRYFSS